MIENIELIVLSFLASFGFGIVFRIERRFLFWAGLGGALTRIVYLILMAITDERAFFMAFAAMFAALYAQIMATVMKTPSTEFLYPSIVPLIPGDLLYDAVVGIVLYDSGRAMESGIKLVVALFYMSLGFTVISSAAHYSRRYKLKKKIAEVGYKMIDSVSNTEEVIEEIALPGKKQKDRK